jgi:hypothetical protein
MGGWTTYCGVCAGSTVRFGLTVLERNSGQDKAEAPYKLAHYERESEHIGSDS